mmetsp:Transcript_59483/g.153160  ORF Transcript_59483/g.153160 Transcript_59483/m.153160 type:complete len:128 (+) Transcript_59483:147-530(+)
MASGPGPLATGTLTQAPSSGSSSSSTPVLHLVLQPRPQNHVQWTEDTVDNEHLNRKKSKKCCIYKKPRAFGESSSDESSGEDDGAARPTGKTAKDRNNRMCPFGQPANGGGPGGRPSSSGGAGSTGA